MSASVESLKNKTVKGSFWSFADNILNMGVSFLVSLVLARLLTPHEYGLIGIITIFIAVFNCVVDSGFSNALIRKTDCTEKDYNTVFIINMGLSLFLFVLMQILAPVIGRFFEQPLLVPMSRVMSLIVLINALAIIQRTILVKHIDFKTQTKISFIASVISGVSGIALALLGVGVWALVFQQIVRQLLNTVFLWLYAKWRPRLEFSKTSFNELFGFGWKLMVSQLINTVWGQLYQVIIGKCYSSQMLGYYTRANQFIELCSTNLNNVVSRVSYPVLSSIKDDRQRLKAAYRKLIKVNMLVSFSLLLGMGAVAKPMVLVLIGEQWLPCVPFIQIVCLSAMMYPLHALNLNMLQVQGRSDLFLKLEIIKKIIAVGPVLIGIFLNIYWMLAVGVCVNFIAYFLNAHYSGPYLDYGVGEQIKDVLPSFGISVIMAVVVFALSFLPLSVYILLPIQLVAGAMIIWALCTFFNLEEYNEMKNIFLQLLKKR